MEEWQKYVPKSKRKEFKEKFEDIVKTKVDSILGDACYHGTHHSCYDCHEEGCDYCLDDSDDRDIKESTKSFHSSLWNQIFEEMNLKPLKRPRSSNDDDKEEDKEDDKEDDNDNNRKKYDE